jgi:DNA-binding NarL/FixJ family response regulator
VPEASSGQEAIEKAHALKPDLIILDITMPVLNGIDAARVIRQTLPELPILLLSMRDGKHIIEDAGRIGIEGYVSKSEASGTLLAAVDAILHNQTFLLTVPEISREFALFFWRITYDAHR